MAGFTYIYRTSDGERRTGELAAESRDAAFVALRAQGIRPIKVIAKDGTRANGEMRGVRKRVVIACVVLTAFGAGLLAYRMGRTHGADVETVITAQGPVTYTIAVPLARQRIPGDRLRIANLPTNLFAHVLEFHLAKFAEPGRPLTTVDTRYVLTNQPLSVALRAPIRLASNDLTEHIDLKRIVTGMKKEMNAYLLGGGTAEGYLAELVKRQKLEIAYREKAEQRLSELLATIPRALESEPVSVAAFESESVSDSAQTGHSRTNESPSGSVSSRPSNSLSEAYDYWLKANAALTAMGIYPLELPDGLRDYQMTLEFE